jgi:hypothetical protein
VGANTCDEPKFRHQSDYIKLPHIKRKVILQSTNYLLREGTNVEISKSRWCENEERYASKRISIRDINNSN